ncbi:MAG: hypothetical protein Q4Q62_03740 [Thermoplasmata archaeon]|nr:hypothetical protein [Thermoplasmata archaeon]
MTTTMVSVRPVPLSTERIGLPAVPEGSPLSLDRSRLDEPP